MHVERALITGVGSGPLPPAQAAEAASFLGLLARARASATLPALRPAAQAARVLQWSGLVAVAAQGALATTFLELPLHA